MTFLLANFGWLINVHITCSTSIGTVTINIPCTPPQPRPLELLAEARAQVGCFPKQAITVAVVVLNASGSSPKSLQEFQLCHLRNGCEDSDMPFLLFLVGCPRHQQTNAHRFDIPLVIRVLLPNGNFIVQVALIVGNAMVVVLAHCGCADPKGGGALSIVPYLAEEYLFPFLSSVSLHPSRCDTKLLRVL